MNTKLIVTLLLMLLNPLAISKTSYQNIKASEVVSVYDGDTIKVNIEGYPPIFGKAISIRIRGIDVPEIRGKCPIEKKKLLKQGII